MLFVVVFWVCFPVCSNAVFLGGGWQRWTVTLPPFALSPPVWQTAASQCAAPVFVQSSLPSCFPSPGFESRLIVDLWVCLKIYCLLSDAVVSSTMTEHNLNNSFVSSSSTTPTIRIKCMCISMHIAKPYLEVHGRNTEDWLKWKEAEGKRAGRVRCWWGLWTILEKYWLFEWKREEVGYSSF